MRHLKERHSLLLTTALALTLSPAFSSALPTGGSVSQGTATISSTSTQTTVTQTTPKSVVNWTGFNTSSGQTVQFNDPSPSSIALNRVSGSATSFDGTLNSNGNVWVINPSGIVIGPTGTVNAAGFLATTSNISDANFMAGTYNFNPGGGPASATVTNEGAITVANLGLAALVAPNVANSGTITGKAGNITLDSGDIYTVDLAGDGLINLAAGITMTQQSISNTGTLNVTTGPLFLPSGGNYNTVNITAAAASKVLDSLINLDGIIEADSLNVQGNNVDVGARYSNAGAVPLHPFSFTIDATGNINRL
jgi:filamentous hemagglutinin family protein